MKVMAAIESCRTAALGGHVARCEDCSPHHHRLQQLPQPALPEVPGSRGQRVDGRAREPSCCRCPTSTSSSRCQRPSATSPTRTRRVIYDLLFKVSADTMLTIAADPKHLGARIAITAVLHTWGSAMTHHPHVHMIVPGGGLSLDGERWIAAKANFLLPVLVLSKLFRRLMLEKLLAAHTAGKLVFFGEHAHLAEATAFAAFLKPLKRTRWFVYSKRPFAGPKAVLAYLSRYTHRVAISNRRLIAADETGVTFKMKDYRVEGPGRYTTMTLATGEFIRRFLLHVLPKGFHRIRHYGLLAGTAKAEMVAKARKLLAVPTTEPQDDEDVATQHVQQCPCCGGRMVVIETFAPGCQPQHRPTTATAAIRIDTS